MAVAPAVHVTYLLSGYPDTKDEWAVTRIHITDPEITVYGLTMNSTNTEIEDRMADITDEFHSLSRKKLADRVLGIPIRSYRAGKDLGTP